MVPGEKEKDRELKDVNENVDNQLPPLAGGSSLKSIGIPKSKSIVNGSFLPQSQLPSQINEPSSLSAYNVGPLVNLNNNLITSTMNLSNLPKPAFANGNYLIPSSSTERNLGNADFEFIGLKTELAVADSPFFRASLIKFEGQLEQLFKWLELYIKMIRNYTGTIIKLKDQTYPIVSINNFKNDFCLIDRNVTSTFESILEPISGFQENLVQTLISKCLEPLQAFSREECRQIKDLLRAHDKTTDRYNQAVIKYNGMPRSKDSSSIREEAYILYEVRKQYIRSCSEVAIRIRKFCRKARNLVMDKMMISLIALTDHTDAIGDTLKGSKGAMMDFIVKAKKQDEFLFDSAFEKEKKQLEVDAIARARPPEPKHHKKGESKDILLDPFSHVSTISNKVEKEGYLFCKGQNKKDNWVRRYFVIRKGGFSYWLVENQGKSKGSVLSSKSINVLLCNVKPIRNDDRKFCFQVSVAVMKRFWILQAENDDEMKDWVATFENSKRLQISSGNLDILPNDMTEKNDGIVIRHDNSIVEDEISGFPLREIQIATDYTIPNVYSTLTEKDELIENVLYNNSNNINEGNEDNEDNNNGNEESNLLNSESAENLCSIDYGQLALKKDNEVLHKVLKSVPKTDPVILSFNSIFYKDKLYKGKVYITYDRWCFYSNILGIINIFVIELKTIKNISATKSTFTTSINIEIDEGIFLFKVFHESGIVEKITKIWQNSLNINNNNNNNNTTNNKVIKITNTDQDFENEQDTISINNNDDNKDIEKEDNEISKDKQDGIDSIGKEELGDGEENVNDNKQNRLTPQELLNTLYSTKDINLDKDKLDTNISGSGEDQLTTSTNLEDLSVEDNSKTVTISGIDFQKTQIYPKTFTAPTNNITCKCTEHLEGIHIDIDIQQCSAIKLFNLLFGLSSNGFWDRHHLKRNERSHVLGKWMNKDTKEPINYNNIKDFNINSEKTSKLPVIGSYREGKMLSPVSNPMVKAKEVDVTFTDTIIDYEPYLYYIIETSSQVTGIPYSDCFSTMTRYCITYNSPDSCHLKISDGTKWIKSTMLKSVIRNTSLKALQETAQDIVKSINKEMTSEIGGEDKKENKSNNKSDKNEDSKMTDNIKDTNNMNNINNINNQTAMNNQIEVDEYSIYYKVGIMMIIFLIGYLISYSIHHNNIGNGNFEQHIKHQLQQGIEKGKINDIQLLISSMLDNNEIEKEMIFNRYCSLYGKNLKENIQYVIEGSLTSEQQKLCTFDNLLPSLQEIRKELIINNIGNIQEQNDLELLINNITIYNPDEILKYYNDNDKINVEFINKYQINSTDVNRVLLMVNNACSKVRVIDRFINEMLVNKDSKMLKENEQIQHIMDSYENSFKHFENMIDIQRETQTHIINTANVLLKHYIVNHIHRCEKIQLLLDSWNLLGTGEESGLYNTEKPKNQPTDQKDPPLDQMDQHVMLQKGLLASATTVYCAEYALLAIQMI